MSAIVVTGAIGFLGRHVAARLRQQGRPVIALSRSAPVDAETVRVARYADFLPPEGAVLLHLAEPAAISAVEATASGHVDAMVRQCRALLSHRWERVIYASSGVVYGDRAPTPRRTSDPIAPGSAYAEAKLACEVEMLAAGGTVARLANLFGHGMAPQTVLPEILAQVGRPGPLRLRNGKVIRDFLAVEDAARGFAILANTAAPNGRIFNLGSGRGWRIEDIAAAALRLANEDWRQILSTDISAAESSLVLNIDDTKRMLDWRPEIALEDWLTEMIMQGVGA